MLAGGLRIEAVGMENEQAPDLLLILSTSAETMPGLCAAISYLIK